MQFSTLFTLFSVYLILSGCLKKRGPQEISDGSGFTSIEIKGVESAEKFPWNQEFLRKTPQERQKHINDTKFAVMLLVNSKDTKCKSNNVKELRRTTMTFGSLTVTRGCTYTFQISFGPSDSDATQDNPKNLTEVWIDTQGGPQSYTIPMGTEKPKLTLKLCPTTKGSKSFDPSKCANLSTGDTDIEIGIEFESKPNSTQSPAPSPIPQMTGLAGEFLIVQNSFDPYFVRSDCKDTAVDCIQAFKTRLGAYVAELPKLTAANRSSLCPNMKAIIREVYYGPYFKDGSASDVQFKTYREKLYDFHWRNDVCPE